MSHFMNGTLEFGYFDERPAPEPKPVQLALDAKGMTLVSAGANGEKIVWHGARRGQGHFHLRAEALAMEGSLHRFADSTIFEGFWRSGPERGFWRVYLPDATPRLLQMRDASPRLKVANSAAKPAPRQRRRVAA